MQCPSGTCRLVQPAFACAHKGMRLMTLDIYSRRQSPCCSANAESAHFDFHSTIPSFPHQMHDQSPSWFVLRSKATADIRYETLIPTVIFTAIASLVVGLRWCSRVTSTTVMPEDYIVTAAMVTSTSNLGSIQSNILILAGILHRIRGRSCWTQDTQSNIA